MFDDQLRIRTIVTLADYSSFRYCKYWLINIILMGPFDINTCMEVCRNCWASPSWNGELTNLSQLYPFNRLSVIRTNRQKNLNRKNANKYKELP